jgi:DNA polymerase III subunit beta
MNFIASPSALLKHLQTISGALSSSAVLPILEKFLFEIKEGNLILSATDLQTSMITSLPVEAKENGKVAVPSSDVISMLKNSPENPISFSVDKNNYSIQVNIGSGRFKWVGENGDDFPVIPVAESSTSVTIPSSVLREAINKTLFAVSNDELRLAMTGVYCELQSGMISFVATDAHKLSLYKRNDFKSDNPANFIIPKKALNLLRQTLPTEDISVEVSYTSSNAFFKFQNTLLVCRLIEEKYPEYSAVIPLNNPNKLTINRISFWNALKRVSIFSNKSTHQVKIKISGAELNIFAEDLDFQNEAQERLSCSYEGEDIEIGFNAKFLIEMLGNIDSEDVVLEMSSPNRAGILKPVEKSSNEEILMLVMPIMISN